MAKYFKAFGILIILFLSFVYTEKTVSVVKEYDDLMIEIKNKASDELSKGENAKIVDNTIIPGLSGKKININKSYSKIKRYGKYNENLLVYDKVLPEISIYDNFDHIIISGNSTKNMVTLMFIIDNNDKLDEIIEILDETDTKAHFFVNDTWLEDNSIYLDSLIKKGHSIGNCSNIDSSSFSWVDTIIKKIAKQAISYCYMENDERILEKCSNNNNFTIKPNIIVDKNPLIEIKKDLKSGSLIAIPINEKNISELKLIINYIKSKGFQLSNLTTHLEE